MRIGLEELDSQIAQAVVDRLCAPINEFLREDIHWRGAFPYQFDWKFHTGIPRWRRKREPSPEERNAYDLRKQREERTALRAVFGATMLPIALGMGTYVSIDSLLNQPALAAAIFAWLAGTVAGIRWTLKATPGSYLRRSLSEEEMRAVFPLLTLTRAERIYCDTLILLARSEVRPDTEPTVRDILRQLNDVTANARQLEARRKALLPVLGTNPIKELEAEYGELGRRLDETKDEAAREAMRRSLQMCSSRLENARTFEQGLERLKAQEEAIVQTLASAQTALARMQLIPEPETAVAAQEIVESVAQMNQQTYAVEQAVQEVMTLRQG